MAATPPEQDLMQTTLNITMRTILMAAFALWFGGFIFYVSFVVPIGTEVLDSTRTQGFITRQVTGWLNLVCGIAVAFMLLESLITWRRSRKTARWFQLTAVLCCIAALAGLVWLHPIMDALIDVDSETISDEIRFYGLHRVYLWLSTLQWAAGCIWLPLLITNWKYADQRP